MKTTRPCTLIRFFVGDHLSHRSHLVRRRDANCTLPNTPRRDPNVFDAVPGTVTADFDIEALAPVIELFFSQISELAFRLTELAPAKELGVCEQRVLIELCMRPTCELTVWSLQQLAGIDINEPLRTFLAQANSTAYGYLGITSRRTAGKSFSELCALIKAQIPEGSFSGGYADGLIQYVPYRQPLVYAVVGLAQHTTACPHQAQGPARANRLCSECRDQCAVNAEQHPR